MVKNAPLEALLGTTSRNYSAPAYAEETPHLFADVRGFHIYGELNLTLQLAAAEDSKDAQRYLGILQEYTLIAEACAASVGAHLLEVQGLRIHLLMPAESPTPRVLQDLAKFSVALTNTVYMRIGKRAGDSFRGFKMAADHGRAIIIKAGQLANCSVISLGPAANAPAKRMGKTPAGHLALRSKHIFTLTGESLLTEWADISVHKLNEKTTAFGSATLVAQFEQATASIMEEVAPLLPDIRYAHGDYLTQYLAGGISAPVKVQGYCMRADLDGFSKQVQAAFEKGEAAIRALVERFLRILLYPDQFGQKMGRTIKLPMAGDCANIIILPNGTGYEGSRDFYPVKAATQWHELGRNGSVPGSRWIDDLAGAKWSVGIAGGGNDESSGVILIASLKGRNRDFLVAAGWGVGRSLDAQEADNVNGDDTVVPDADYKALDTAHRRPFREHGIFWLAKDLTIKKVEQTGVSVLASEKPFHIAGISKAVPAPRPHAKP